MLSNNFLGSDSHWENCAMASLFDEVKLHLKKDLNAAISAAKEAEQILRRGPLEPYDANFLVERRAALSLILSRGFFAKVEGSYDPLGKEEDFTFYISEA